MKKKLLIVTLLTASTMVMAGNYSRSNNIVTDHDTGLQWQDAPYTAAEKAIYNSTTKESGRVLKWKNSKGYCSNLGNGWRLASIKELLTIVDKSQFNPAMDPIFESALPLGFWSATLSVTTGGSAQGIGFASGKIHNCGTSGKAKFIRCVRAGGGSTPPPPKATPTPAPTPATPTPAPTQTPTNTGSSNTPPAADAGADKTVQVNNPITITGKGDDSDGAIVSYQWKKKSDGSIWSNDEILVFTPSGTRSKTFVLTVTDDEGAKDTDEMILTVTKDATPPPPTTTSNMLPTADAGADETVQVNNPITITGKGDDSDGAIVSYQWKKKSDGSIWSNDEILVFTPSGTRTKTFVLTVTDDEGAKDTDEMILTVTKDATPPATTGNSAPIASAGSNKTVQVNNTVTITGSSTDSDGDIVKYEWKKQSSGQVLAKTESFDFTPSGTRTKTLVFTVTDAEGAKDTDTMTLTVTK